MVFLVLCATLFAFMPIITYSSYVVETPFGKINGAEATAMNNKKYVAFWNIPYAKPPLGKLRFAKPEPHPKLEDILDATNETIISCPQPEGMASSVMFEASSEDCLILNVFVPKLDYAVRKVIVLIHGGGFILGGSAMLNAGSFLTNHDVVVVTINYRLSLLGFLSMENEASPGNYGLWDQVLALKWVKDNIASFGGDVDDITISGESAGSMSVSYHCLTSVTKGLFTKAYSQSATASSAFSVSQRAQTHALSFAKSANCWDGELSDKIDAAQSLEVMDCLRKLPSTEMNKFSDFGMKESIFVPTVDGEFIQRPALELLHDQAYLESIGFFDKSYIFGIDNNERAFIEMLLFPVINFIRNMNTSDQEKDRLVLEQRASVLQNYLRSRLRGKEPSEKVKAKVVDWYERREGEKAIGGLITDLSFLIPAYDFLEALARRGPTKAWFLYFKYFPRFMKGPHKGMLHGTDLIYWMDAPLDKVEDFLHFGIQGDLDEEDLQLKASFCSIVAEFMKSGNPSLALNDILPAGWPTFDLHGSQYLDFNLEPSIKAHLESEKRDLWIKKVPEWAEEHVHTEL